MTRLFVLGSLLLMLFLVGCDVEPEPETLVEQDTATRSATATTQAVSPTALPETLPTGLPESEATETMTATVTAEATATNTAVFTPTPSTPLAVANEMGQVTLSGKIVLDYEEEGIPCYRDIPAEILYAPDNQYFLVIPACIEADNELYLFRADGTGKQRITGAWDVLNGSNVVWSEDSRSFTYERINSCCLVPPADAPPRGLVQYNINTNDKLLVATPTPRP